MTPFPRRQRYAPVISLPSLILYHVLSLLGENTLAIAARFHLLRCAGQALISAGPAGDSGGGGNIPADKKICVPRHLPKGADCSIFAVPLSLPEFRPLTPVINRLTRNMGRYVRAYWATAVRTTARGRVTGPLPTASHLPAVLWREYRGRFFPVIAFTLFFFHVMRFKRGCQPLLDKKPG